MVHKLCIYFSLFLLSLTCHVTANEDPGSQVEVSLIHETQSIQPGQPIWVAIHLKIQENWHTYWKNPGDAGMATAIDWDLPTGFTASPIIWPVPEQFSIDSMLGYGYEDEVFLLTQIQTPKDLPLNNKVELKGHVRWLVCSDSQCVPGQGDIAASMPVSNDKPKESSQWTHLFARARTQLPLKQDGVEAIRKRDIIELQLSLPSQVYGRSLQAYFCPEEKAIIDHSVDAEMRPSVESPNKYHVVLRETEDSQKARTPSLKGVLVFMTKQEEPVTVHAVDIDLPITDTLGSQNMISMVDKRETVSAATAAESSSEEPLLEGMEFEGGLAMALLLAFAGGMLLNLMPCVLPVVSFKVLSFVKMAGQKRSVIMKHGVSFFVGVLVSFWILAGVLLLLQSYGSSVGWGFQLQEPWFVALLASLLLVFGLSMFGVFEMGTKLTSLAGNAEHRMKNEGLTGSFFSGMLATVVATPCTGPLLGTAIGFAATLSAWASMSIFTAMGVGMAFPYLILAFFPRLLRFLPKPGPWMETFKELMGFLMIATVIWLVWVFGAQTDNNAVVFLLTGFFLLSLGCWCYGKWGSPVKHFASRIFGIATAAAFMAMGGYVIFLASQSPGEILIADASSDISRAPDIYEWVAFSPEKVAEYQKRGIPVLIDFTAKWCLICQANHLVFESEDVENKLAELGVVKMKADWTRNDQVITQELRKFGRSGVPLYVLYTGDAAKAPVILPQVLTPAIVFQELKAVE